MKFERYVGVRYLLSARKNTFLSVISILSIMGIATGVCFLIMVTAVMEGFEEDLRKSILGLDAHIFVRGLNGLTDYESKIPELKKIEGIIGASAFIEGEILFSLEDKNRGGLLSGIDLKNASSVIDLSNYMMNVCQGISLEKCFSKNKTYLPLVLRSSWL